MRGQQQREGEGMTPHADMSMYMGKGAPHHVRTVPARASTVPFDIMAAAPTRHLGGARVGGHTRQQRQGRAVNEEGSPVPGGEQSDSTDRSGLRVRNASLGHVLHNVRQA